MNRRNFLNSILQAGAAFSILPGSLLYQRTWKPVKAPVIYYGGSISGPFEVGTVHYYLGTNEMFVYNGTEWRNVVSGSVIPQYTPSIKPGFFWGSL